MNQNEINEAYISARKQLVGSIVGVSITTVVIWIILFISFAKGGADVGAFIYVFTILVGPIIGGIFFFGGKWYFTKWTVRLFSFVQKRLLYK